MTFLSLFCLVSFIGFDGIVFLSSSVEPNKQNRSLLRSTPEERQISHPSNRSVVDSRRPSALEFQDLTEKSNSGSVLAASRRELDSLDSDDGLSDFTYRLFGQIHMTAVGAHVRGRRFITEIESAVAKARNCRPHNWEAKLLFPGLQSTLQNGAFAVGVGESLKKLNYNFQKPPPPRRSSQQPTYGIEIEMLEISEMWAQRMGRVPLYEVHRSKPSRVIRTKAGV
ncbi:uncharacterized protein CIMG_13008 [Coccidioides immitis RS]|uniref:Uncharacterized protein n=1 Tax=Coccidioides immitis (strain RS) TaxID=246410 RepID=A0A0D8JT69_COCIM|nr:uncharacterized protein CIMG_13008 [Coccidioides immitis RS]KJF60492.1 hypothetical protein CIMG_13008 [Coccidioides immitis RS]